MADWQKGDLALCIKMGPWVGDITGEVLPGEKPKPGRVYTVETVTCRDGITLLFLVDVVNARPFWASRFRKVTPQSEDAFDRKVIDHMAGQEA